MIDRAMVELAPLVGVRAGCAALGEPQARWYRRHRQTPQPEREERVPVPQPRALSEVERKEVLRVLHDPEHVDYETGDAEEAIRLWARASAVRDRIGLAIETRDRHRYEHQLAQARARLGEERVDAIWEQANATHRPDTRPEQEW